MKNAVRKIGVLTVVTLVFLLMQSCGSKSEKANASTALAKEVSTSQNVKMVYFHATRRCLTCTAVEEVTKQTLAKHYDNKISFESFNRDEEQNKALVEKYKIGGQTLLLLTGDKVVNLTNEAFLYARVQPEKFEQILIEKLNAVLN